MAALCCEDASALFFERGTPTLLHLLPLLKGILRHYEIHFFLISIIHFTVVVCVQERYAVGAVNITGQKDKVASLLNWAPCREGVWVNGSIAPLTVNFETGRRWVVSFRLWPLYTRPAGPGLVWALRKREQSLVHTGNRTAVLGRVAGSVVSTVNERPNSWSGRLESFRNSALQEEVVTFTEIHAAKIDRSWGTECFGLNPRFGVLKPMAARIVRIHITCQ